MWSLRTPKGQSLAVARLPAVVGSARGAGVRVPHASVAAEHARLRAGENGSLLIEAIGDAVVGCGGRRVRRGVLRDGDELILGRLRFTLVRSEAATDAHTAPSARAATAPSARASTAPKPRSAAASPPLTQRTGRTARRPAAGGRAPDELLVPRGVRELPTRRGPARRGLLHADLSQYSIGMRLVIVLVLLGLCGGLVVAISLAFGLVG
ncbi:MAG: FHA domain-containing protein [Planctomycetota bacterium]|jgi:hypothetical protein